MNKFTNFIRRIFNKLLATSPPVDMVGVEEEPTAYRPLSELGKAAAYWEALSRTYSDGINILDDVTLEMVTRSLQQRLRLDGIFVIDCEIEEFNNQIYIDVYVIEDNRMVKYRGEK